MFKLKIKSIKKLNHKAQVYDLSVEQNHNFFVGQNQVLTHNCDYMSQAAQGMLRDVMETNASTCRFVATCNFEHKIIPPLKSRFQHLRFKAPDRDDVLVRMAEILIAEDVDFEAETLDKYITQAYPDLRKIINNLQLNTNAGKLNDPTADADGEDYQFKLLDLLTAGKLDDISSLVVQQCTPEQISDVYQFLESNLHLHPKLKSSPGVYEQCLCLLLDAVHKHGVVALVHLNFRVLIIKLKQALL